jgi:hypothetical protein
MEEGKNSAISRVIAGCKEGEMLYYGYGTLIKLGRKGEGIGMNRFCRRCEVLNSRGEIQIEITVQTPMVDEELQIIGAKVDNYLAVWDAMDYRRRLFTVVFTEDGAYNIRDFDQEFISENIGSDHYIAFKNFGTECGGTHKKIIVEVIVIKNGKEYSRVQIPSNMTSGELVSNKADGGSIYLLDDHTEDKDIIVDREAYRCCTVDGKDIMPIMEVVLGMGRPVLEIDIERNREIVRRIKDGMAEFEWENNRKYIDDMILRCGRYGRFIRYV